MNILINMIAGPIIDGVMKGIQNMNALKQFERMQGEVLEGWIFRVQIAVERELKKANVSHEVYIKVAAAIDKFVTEEFDTTKL